ncbi:MAG TPA: type II CAAX endopeptidase family protein [Microthrixaceae bacterium]|nr:type II CAAX endopeptidase family protein [Microthrixaceae bacterium]
MQPELQRWGLGEVGIGIAASFVLSNVIGVLIFAAAGWKVSADVPMWGLGLLQIPLWAGYLGAVYLAGRKGTGMVSAFGIQFKPLDVPLGLVLGIVTQVVLLPLLYIPIFQLTGTSSEELSKPAEDLASTAGGTVSWLLFALLVGIIAPTVEEVFYRGLFLRGLRKHGFGTVAAVVMSSAVFGALHLQPLQFPGLFLFGMIAAGLAVVTRRLGLSIFAHIGFNLTTVFVLFLNR